MTRGAAGGWRGENNILQREVIRIMQDTRQNSFVPYFIIDKSIMYCRYTQDKSSTTWYQEPHGGRNKLHLLDIIRDGVIKLIRKTQVRNARLHYRQQQVQADSFLIFIYVVMVTFVVIFYFVIWIINCGNIFSLWFKDESYNYVIFYYFKVETSK